jgi:hypothetical protein
MQCSRRAVLAAGGAWATAWAASAGRASAAARVDADAAAADRVVATPTETDELLANPGMGWQTFHQFADRDKSLAGLPSSSAYFRFYWKEIESDDAVIDFPKLDDLMGRAARAGQRLALRVACVGGGGYSAVPAYLKGSGCKGWEYQADGKGPMHWTPDMDDPAFQKAHFRLVDELAKRYDGKLDLLDIGTVGLWGEWHMSGTKVAMPSQEARATIIGRWCRAFPQTPKVMLIGDVDGLRRAFALRAGWRADCIGDFGGFSKNWNHMENLYPQNLAKSGAADVWKTAPVAYESCWDMRKWVTEKWDVRRVFDFALATHASYLNNKSTPIPDGTRPEVERFLRKLGYRLVLRRVEHPAAVAAGGTLNVSLTWENVGVAPPYRDHAVAVRLTDARGVAHVLAGKTSVKGMLPGTHETAEAFTLPASVAAGRGTVSVGVVDPQTNSPAVRLAIAGRDAAGWYPVSAVAVG